MLIKFEVQGFKGFSQNLVLDLSKPRDYEFNKECIKNRTVKSAIVYGKNGVGKSNLGLAIFDLISHLTSLKVQRELYNDYLNAEDPCPYATFQYHFKFEVDGDFHYLRYNYGKSNINLEGLIFEELLINDKVVAKYDRRDENPLALFNLNGTESLKTELENASISVLPYIANNSILAAEDNNNKVFLMFMDYVKKMLYFKSLDSRTYMGFKVGSESVTQSIIKNNNLGNFQKFLHAAGIECALSIGEVGTDDEISEDIVFTFPKTKNISFVKIASTGTKTLALLFHWLYHIQKEVKFVFIDEFDAFYHHELSQLVVEELKKTNTQFILTTHNTSIISNELLRPDCYFLMKKNSIKAFSENTEKELREIHNIEKMYKAGSFTNA